MCWVEQDAARRAPASTTTGYWAVSKHADVAAVSKNSKDFSSQRERRDHPVRRGHDPRPGRAAEHHADQPGPAGPHQDPPDHQPRVHAAGDRRAARRADRRGRTRSSTTPWPRVRATSSTRWPPSCRCRRSPTCSAYRWRTGASCSTGPTRCSPTTTRSTAAQPDVAAAEILGYAMGMAEDAQGNPRDDIITKLVTATSTGSALAEDEFGYFVIMLAVAGNETTRNAITHGMNAFFDHPDQWELLQAGAPDDDGRRDHPVGHARHGLPAHRPQRRDGRRPAGQEGRAGRALLRQRQQRRGRLRRPATRSTYCATRTRTWPSAAMARTTASAPTWPGSRSR